LPKKVEATERTCIVTRTALPVGELIRFVVAPGGELVPDLRRRLPGRGVWVTKSAEKVAEAERRKLFQKQFEGGVKVEAGLAGRVDALLVAAATGALAMARKAGTLVAGFGKVEDALARESVVALIHAAEAAPDGVARLNAAARRRAGSQPAVIRYFAGEQLDLAFGRPNVIHAALLAGPASDYLLARVGDLAAYRGERDPLDSAGAAFFDASNGMNDLSSRTIGTHD
jgi:predicted RNA-binding protein YlxR (DUF448 family)